jgi:hypothetical protein
VSVVPLLGYEKNTACNKGYWAAVQENDDDDDDDHELGSLHVIHNSFCEGAYYFGALHS